MRFPANRTCTGSVGQFLDTSYDVVKKVYDNLDSIGEIAQAMEVDEYYLGYHATAPTLRGDGTPLKGGDYYIDSTTSSAVFYDIKADVWISITPAELSAYVNEAKQSAEEAASSADSAADALSEMEGLVAELELSEAGLKFKFIALEGQIEFTLGEEYGAAPTLNYVCINGRTLTGTEYVLDMGTITLIGYIPNAGDVIHGLANLKTLPEVTLLGAESYSSVESMVSDTSIEEGAILVTTSNILGTGLGGATYVATVGGESNTLNPLLDNGYVAVNVSQNLTLTMTGALGDGEYSQHLNDIGKSLDTTRSLFIDIAEYSLAQPVYFNNGFKRITSLSDNKVTSFLELPEDTTVAMFNVNMQEVTGIPWNLEDTGQTNLEALSAEEGDDQIIVADISAFELGDCLRFNGHVCRVAKLWVGLVDEAVPEDGIKNIVEMDRPVPVDVEAGFIIYKMLYPNTDSYISLGNLDFNGTEESPRAGFGLLAANCINLEVNGVHGTHVHSKVCEIMYNADSEVKNITSLYPVTITGGRGYAVRVSSGNDNFVTHVDSHKGRHCVDLTFSHRNMVTHCNDYSGRQASYLTHGNRCTDNIFDNCNLYNCDFGVVMNSDGGDKNNTWQNSLVINSRAFYRPTADTILDNITVRNDNIFVDLFYPRENGESVLNLKNSSITNEGYWNRGSFPHTVNFDNCSFSSGRQFTLVKEGSTELTKINFNNSRIIVNSALARNALESTITFNNCTVDFYAQVFGENCGTVKSYNTTWKNRSGVTNTTVFTVSGDRETVVTNSVLEGEAFWFRTYDIPTFGEGTLLIGNNSLLDGAVYGSMNQMTFSNIGELELASYADADAGNPLTGTTVSLLPSAVNDSFKIFYTGTAWLHARTV